MNWQKLYSILRKELPRQRDRSLMPNIVRDYAKNCGINLTTDQVNNLIAKFA